MHLLDLVGVCAARDAVALHGAGAVRCGNAYVFVAASGGGKSTLSAICDRYGFPVLGDDCIVVLEREGAFYARPMFRQADKLPVSIPVGDETKLRRFFFLEQASQPSLQRVAPLKASARCVKEKLILGFADMNPQDRAQVLGRLARLFRAVPVYVLQFSKDNRFWKVIDALESEKARRVE